MNTVKLFADDYAATLTKLSDGDLSAEIRRALLASAQSDAASTGAGEKVLACHSETQRRNKAFIYDEAYVEFLFGSAVAAQVHRVHAMQAA